MPVTSTLDAGRVTGWTNVAGRTVSIPVEAFRAEDLAADLSMTAQVNAPVTVKLADATLANPDRTTKATISVPPNTPSGAYDVVIRASDGSRTRSVTVRLKVDSDRPVAAIPAVTLPVGSTFQTTSFLARARWGAATDASNPISGYQASWRVNGGTLVVAGLARRVEAHARPDIHDQRPVRAAGPGQGRGRQLGLVGHPAHSSDRRRAGHERVDRPVGNLAINDQLELLAGHGDLRQGGRRDADPHVHRPDRSPGCRPSARAAAAARVYIDGSLFTTVSQYRADPGYRKVVFERSWVSSGTHTIRIEVVGTSGRPRVDLDALVVIR